MSSAGAIQNSGREQELWSSASEAERFAKSKEALKTVSFEAVADLNVTGGVRLVRTGGDARAAEFLAPRPGPLGIPGDLISLSDESLRLAANIAAIRDEQAKNLSAEERYAAALAFGVDMQAELQKNCDIEAWQEEGWSGKVQNKAISSTYENGAQSVTSKAGTVVSVASTAATYVHENVLTLQITRKDGLQLNLAFDEDLRITDLEDGSLEVYSAQSGLLRRFDVDGKETLVQGEAGSLRGTDADDILVNRFSTFVDGGDGNDTIVNLANGTTILGGSGNDTLLLTSQSTGLSASQNVTLDGGEGDDLIAGNIADSTIRMEQGSDALRLNEAWGVTIHSGGAGQHSVIAKTMRRVDMTHEGENGLSIAAYNIDESQLRLSDSSDTLFVGRAISRSLVDAGGGDDSISIGDNIYMSSVQAGDGDDLIKVGRHVGDSVVDGGNGDDTIYVPRGNFSTKEVNAENWVDTLTPEQLAEMKHSYETTIPFEELQRMKAAQAAGKLDEWYRPIGEGVTTQPESGFWSGSLTNTTTDFVELQNSMLDILGRNLQQRVGDEIMELFLDRR